MKRRFTFIEPNPALQPYRGAYQEIAIFVRELLQCDYALVALPEKDSIRIQGFAGTPGETNQDIAGEVMLRLRDWGPLVVDDARLIAAPVSSGDQVMGVLIGYSSKPGTFTAHDLEKLMSYTYVAAGILATASTELNDDTASTLGGLGSYEPLHFSRLITMGQLSACFAHEVNNPLQLIRGHIRFIEERLKADDPMRADFDAIVRASRRIEEMTKRMLDFSRKRPRRTEECDLAVLISDAMRFVQPHYKTSFVDVQVELDPQLPVIHADRWQLMQAIVNILQNAADAMADVDRRVLSITAGGQDERIRLVISDSGSGIAPSHVPRVFEPFFTTKGERGTGLGLYITKQIIEEHHGTVDVLTSDRGTSFVISLPL